MTTFEFAKRSILCGGLFLFSAGCSGDGTTDDVVSDDAVVDSEKSTMVEVLGGDGGPEVNQNPEGTRRFRRTSSEYQTTGAHKDYRGTTTAPSTPDKGKPTESFLFLLTGIR